MGQLKLDSHDELYHHVNRLMKQIQIGEAQGIVPTINGVESVNVQKHSITFQVGGMFQSEDSLKRIMEEVEGVLGLNSMEGYSQGVFITDLSGIDVDKVYDI